MSTTNPIEESGIFDNLSEAERKAFIKTFTRMPLKAGEPIFKEGDSGDTLYIVEKGAVSLKKSITADVEKKLLLAQEGWLFGEFSFMDGGIRSATAQAEKNSVLMSLERKDFDAFMAAHPSAGMTIYDNLLKIVVQRLRLTNEAYRDAIRWGLDLTGTPALNFHYLITEDIRMSIELISGRSIEGNVLQLETSEAGYQVIMVDTSGHTVIIPYHAVVSVTMAR